MSHPVKQASILLSLPDTRLPISCIKIEFSLCEQSSIPCPHASSYPIMDIPKTQKALITDPPGPNTKSVIKEIPVPTPGEGEILVKLNCTGLCHSDVHLMRNDWGDRGLSMMTKIAGHEGAGVVVAIGPNVTRFKVGDRAGIKWVADVCGECEMCTNGTDELQCPKQLNSGFTAAGTFQQFATATARYATRIPDGVSDEEAGPVSTLPFTYVPNGSPELTVHFQLGDVWRSYGIRSAKTIRCSRGTVGCHHGSKRWTRSLRCTIC